MIQLSQLNIPEKTIQGILDFLPVEATIEAQKTRQRIKQLLLPYGFGERFKALVQEKT